MKKTEATTERGVPSPVQPREGGWGQPTNIFAEFPAPPFPFDTIPAELAEYPRLYARQTGFDQSIPVVSAVAAAAAALSDAIQVCAEERTRWCTQPRLWVLVAGSPGCGKTPGQRQMLAPLWEIHWKLDSDWQAGNRGLPTEAKAPRPRAIVSDTTIEKLGEVLAENPRGITVVADEMDSWLGSMDQYRSGGVGRDRGEWLKLFDGGPHTVERVRRGTLFVRNWGCSILTGTTPAALKRLARFLPEDGLIQRFIVVHVRRPGDSVEVEAERMEAAERRYAEIIRRLWAVTPKANAGVVSLSAAAKERFESWRRENRQLQEALGSIEPAIEGHIAKYPTLALRLALIFHAVRVVSADEPAARDPAAHAISLESIENALAFLRCASQHALAFYLGRGGGASDGYELARTVARYILARDPERNAKGLQRRELIASVSAFRKADGYVQDIALQVLQDLDWIRVSRGAGYRKPHPTRFDVNPLVHDRFAGLAAQERARRALVREKIAFDVQERRREKRHSEMDDM